MGTWLRYLLGARWLLAYESYCGCRSKPLQGTVCVPPTFSLNPSISPDLWVPEPCICYNSHICPHSWPCTHTESVAVRFCPHVMVQFHGPHRDAGSIVRRQRWQLYPGTLHGQPHCWSQTCGM